MSDDGRQSEERLKPARPDAHEGTRPGYMPRIPWKWLIVGASVLSIVGLAQWLRVEREADGIRTAIVHAYDGQLGPAVRRYRGFRAKIEGWVIDEARDDDAPARRADPRLQIAALHKGQGLYLRVRAREARDAERLAAAARVMEGDAVGRCLGITPISMRGFYEAGDFLMPRWIEEVEQESSVAKLRLLDDDLATRIERNIPRLSNMMGSQYLLLVLERGDATDDPVDVFLWDLRQDNLLLSLRTTPTGLLIPARIELPGVEPAPRIRPQQHAHIAADCSIAAAIKEVTGEPSLTFGSEMPDLSAPAEPAPEEEAPAQEEPAPAAEE